MTFMITITTVSLKFENTYITVSVSFFAFM